MKVAIGRFGPYIQHNGVFVSIPKDIDPLEITAQQAIELIEAKEKKDREKIIKIFDDKEPILQVLNGRYGPYISYEKKNYKIPKTTEPKELSFDDCMKIIEETQKKKAKGK